MSLILNQYHSSPWFILASPPCLSSYSNIEKYGFLQLSFVYVSVQPWYAFIAVSELLTQAPMKNNLTN